MRKEKLTFVIDEGDKMDFLLSLFVKSFLRKPLFFLLRRFFIFLDLEFVMCPMLRLNSRNLVFLLYPHVHAFFVTISKVTISKTAH
jgi:hypothetical protein